MNVVPFLLMAVFMLEGYLAMVLPYLLGRLAFVPLGEARSIELSPRAAQVLTEVVQTSGEAAYRAAPVLESRFESARLPGAVDVDGATHALRFAPERNEVLARTSMDMRRKARPVVRVRMQAEGRRLALRARYYPSQSLSLALFLLLVGIMSRGVALLVFVPFFALPMLFDRRKARELYDAVESEVRARVRVLEDGVPGVRVADDASAEVVEGKPAEERRAERA
jgi:hypothetical protein